MNVEYSYKYHSSSVCPVPEPLVHVSVKDHGAYYSHAMRNEPSVLITAGDEEWSVVVHPARDSSSLN